MLWTFVYGYSVCVIDVTFCSFQPGQIIDIRAMINEATRMNVEEGAQDSQYNVGIFSFDNQSLIEPPHHKTYTLHVGKYNPSSSENLNFKVVVYIFKYAGWFVSDLVGNQDCFFSYETSNRRNPSGKRFYAVTNKGPWQYAEIFVKLFISTLIKFSLFYQKKESGYTLEHYNEYPQSMFRSKSKKDM